MTDPNFTQDSVLTPEYVRRKIEIRHQEDGGTKQTYQDASGKITSAVYHLYPGITLIRKNVHRPHFISNWRNKPERGLVIEHCWEGRLEYQENQDCLHHAPGDVIVFRKGTPAYLEEYYNSDSIILLQREKNKNKGNDSAENEATEETTDPYEMYYSIDADLIIGTTDTVDEELYAVLSQIAPTIVTGYAIDNTDGMYAGVKENARLIASIWGAEDKLDDITAEYDALYQQLDETLDGVMVVMLNSSLDTNRVEVVSNDDIESSDDKREAERSGRILLDLGMVMYSKR